MHSDLREDPQAAAIIEPLSSGPGRSSEALLSPPACLLPFLLLPFSTLSPWVETTTALWVGMSLGHQRSSAASGSLPTVERMLGQRPPTPPQSTTLDSAASLSLRAQEADTDLSLGVPCGMSHQSHRRLLYIEWGSLSAPCGVRGQPPFNVSALGALGLSCRAPMWGGAGLLLLFQETLVRE